MGDASHKRFIWPGCLGAGAFFAPRQLGLPSSGAHHTICHWGYEVKLRVPKPGKSRNIRTIDLDESYKDYFNSGIGGDLTPFFERELVCNIELLSRINVSAYFFVPDIKQIDEANVGQP